MTTWKDDYTRSRALVVDTYDIDDIIGRKDGVPIDGDGGGATSSGGAEITQTTFYSVTSGTYNIVTHESDPDFKRMVQVYGDAPGYEGLTDTTLDFDEADEADYSQEDAALGTDFTDGVVRLHASVGASEFTEKSEFYADDLVVSAHIGYAVALSGDTAILASRDADPGAVENAGAAYVFTTSDEGTTWSQQQKLEADNPTSEDRFGFAVAIRGNICAITCPGDDTAGSFNFGGVYVWKRVSTTWSIQQKIFPGDLVNADQLGDSISMSSDSTTMAIGCMNSDPGALSAAGAVYIYVTADGGDTWTFEQKLIASDKAASDRFGWAVGVDGDKCIVGVRYRHTSGQADSGAVYTFTRSGTTWTQEEILTANTPEANAAYGYSVSIDGNLMVVGCYGEDAVNVNSGTAYLYKTTDGGATWVQKHRVLASDAVTGDLLGYTVAIGGNLALIGSNSIDPGGLANAGAVYAFSTSDSGDTWTEDQKLIPPDIEAGDSFGKAAAIDGTLAIISAYYSHPEATVDAGSAYAYKYGPVESFVTGPFYVATTDTNHIDLASKAHINSVTIDNTEPTNTTLGALISFDGRSTWKYWDGDSFEDHAGITTTSGWSTVSGIEAGLTNYTVTSGTSYLDLAFLLETTSSGVTPSVDLVTMDYDGANFYKRLSNTEYGIDCITATNTSIVKLTSGTDSSVKVNILL